MTPDQIDAIRTFARGLPSDGTAPDTAILQLAWDYEDLQSQLAAANERADGLQRIVNEAREQEPVAWQWQDVNGDWFNPFSEKHLKDTADAGYPTRPLYAAPVPAQPAVVPEGLANAVLANIAAIAHCGGLAKLDNENALSNIRQLSKPWCDNTGTLRDLKNRVDAAILSATDTKEERKDE